MDPVKLNFNLDVSHSSNWLTVTADPFVRDGFVYVQELGDFLCGPDYYTVRENLPSYLIKLTLSGEGTLEYDGEIFRCTAGKLFWIDCVKPQRYYTSHGAQSWHTLWVHLYGATADAYYRVFLEQNGGRALVDTENDPRFLELINWLLQIYSAEKSDVQGDIRASNLLTQLMAGCIELAGERIKVRQTSRYAEEIKAYIEQNYKDEITLDKLAQTFSMNKFYLQKLFKRHVGLSPGEYVARTRLGNAKHLLRTTGFSIQQIAERVGYTPSYFDNIFKKYEGVTPQAYRQRWYDSSAPEN